MIQNIISKQVKSITFEEFYNIVFSNLTKHDLDKIIKSLSNRGFQFDLNNEETKLFLKECHKMYNNILKLTETDKKTFDYNRFSDDNGYNHLYS